MGTLLRGKHVKTAIGNRYFQQYRKSNEGRSAKVRMEGGVGPRIARPTTSPTTRRGINPRVPKRSSHQAGALSKASAFFIGISSRGRDECAQQTLRI